VIAGHWLVVPFVLIYLRCIGRHFSVVHAATRTSWPWTIGVVLASTIVLGALLALAGHRGE